MNKHIYLILFSLIFSLTFVGVGDTSGQSISILPLGNSITEGYDDSDPPVSDRIAYRASLDTLLNEAGYTFDFLGHGWDGEAILLDANHAGMPGALGQDVVTLLQNGYDVQGDDETTLGQPYLDVYRADIILLHIGTNDIIPTGNDASEITNILNVIDLWEAENSHHITVFVARIINKVPSSTIITEYNENLADIVNGRFDPSVILVDMEIGAGIDYDNEMVADGYHPTVSGYSKMGQKWFDEIDAYLTALPDAPSGLIFSGESSNSIDISWTDNSSDETGFEIWRSLSASGPFLLVDTWPAEAESYTDNSLSENQEYFYRVNAVNLTGPSSFISGSTSTLLLPLPAAPTGLSVGTVTATSIPLTWTDLATNESSYVVQRSSDGSAYTDLPSLPANSTSFPNTGLPNNTTYYYRVYAKNATGNSAPSNVVSATTLLPRPAAPTGLSVGTVTATSIPLTWTDLATNESSYVVQRSSDGSAYTDLPSLPANSTSFPNTGLPNNTTYYYRVYAKNATGNSDPSNVVSATTLLPRPAAPTNLSVGTVTATSIPLTWTDLATNESSYVVQRSSDGSAYTDLPSLPANSTSFPNTGLPNNTTYYYRVYAKNATGNSPPSNVVSATTLLPRPAAPTGLSVGTVTATSIPLTWTDVASNESSYVVQRSSDGSAYTDLPPLPANSTSFPNTGLPNNTTYYYRVYAKNATGDSDPSNEVSATTLLPLPAAPSNMAFSLVTENSMTIRWQDNSGNADYFEIQRSLSEDSGFEELGTPTAPSWDDSGLGENLVYYYRVRARNATGPSAWLEGSQRTQLLAPLPPSNMTFSLVTENSMRINWQDNSGNEANFEIQRSLTAGSGFQELGTPTDPSWDDSGLEENTAYFYRVRSVNATASSAWITGSQATQLLAPRAPDRLAGSATDVCSVDLRWRDRSSNEESFEVQRYSPLSSEFITIQVLPPDTEEYTDADTENNTSYSYRIAAVNGTGTVYSDIEVITVSIALDGGMIRDDQLVCPEGDPETILNDQSPSGGSNSWTYQWQSRIVPALFADIPGATGISYDPPDGALFTTEYHRISTVECGSAASNIVTISVDDLEDPQFTSCPLDEELEIERNALLGTLLTADPVFTDNCEVSSLSWSMTGATTGSSPETGINYVGQADFLEGTTTITYLAKDLTGNTGTCEFNVTVKIKDPEILNVSIPNGTMKIGDPITATIEVSDDGNTVYTMLSGDIGGYPLEGLVRINSTTYLANFLVIEGGNSYQAAEDIPVGNLVLSDGLTPSLPYTLPISQDNDLLDAELPLVISANLVEGFYKIGDEVVINILTDGSFYTLNPASSVNGILVTEPNMSFVEMGLNSYQLIYTVLEGDADIAAGEFEASLIFDKPSGNSGDPYTNIGNVGLVEIDANPPVVGRIELPDEEVGVEGVVVAFITADGTAYTASSGTLINSVPISSSKVEFTEVGNGLYSLTYEVSASDNVVDPGDLEMSIILKDSAGNIGEPFDIVEENELEIYTQLPLTHMVTLPEICEGEEAEIIVYLVGRNPFSIELFDGSSTILIEDIDASTYKLLVSPLETTTYSIPVITDRNGVENSGSGSVKITVNESTPVNIINLQSGYSVEDPPFRLEADIPGGIFYGPGVDSPTGEFRPALADTIDSPHTIYYEVENSSGCMSVDSALVFVLGAEGDIYIPSPDVCDNSDPFQVTASNVAGVVGSFTLIDDQDREVAGLVDNGDNTATIGPGLLSAGIYTIEYAYFDAVMLYIRENFELIYVTQPEILSPSGITSFCQNEDLVKLVANDGSAYFYGEGVTGNIDDGFVFNPAAAPLGEVTLKCIIYGGSACEKETELDLTVNRAPEARFTISSSCLPDGGGMVDFINQSTSTGVETWSWEFGDLLSGADNYSDEINPGHFYPYPGEWTISLSASTYDGCVSKFVLDTVFSSIPNSDFTWISDCFMDQQGVEFVNLTTVGSTPLESMKWIFMTESGDLIDEVISDSDTIEYQFPNAASYQVGLQTLNQGACSDTLTKRVELRPTIKLDSEGYAEAFDLNSGGWTLESADENSSWVWGTPDFEGYIPDGDGNAMYTDLRGYGSGYVEHSWIQSPCFDFSDMSRPMIRLDVMRSFVPNVNGSVLQYLENREEGWKTIGVDSEGINWYNSFNIYNQPGGSAVGWGLDVFNPDTDWVETAQDLSSLRGKDNVSLRLALATNGAQGIGNQGFAFDNLMISEKTKLAVLEYFTNSSDEDSYYADIQVDNYAKANRSELIDIHYHTSFPGDDPMNQNNPGMVSARAGNLGVGGQVPYAVLDGATNSEHRYDFSTIDNSPGSEELDLLSLSIPSFNIDLEVDWTDTHLTAYTTVTCNVESYSEYIQLYIVVLESLVTNYEGSNGDSAFRNVALKMLPSTGKLLRENWDRGTSMSLANQWIYEPYVEDVDDLLVVAFVQDRSTEEILQAEFNYKTIPTGIGNKLAEIKELKVYPNPAKDYLYVNLGSRSENTGILEVYDLSGRMVLNLETQAGYQIFNMDVQQLSRGMYLIRRFESGELVGLGKFIKTE